MADKTIQEVISVDFVPKRAEINSKSLEIISAQIYDNRKSSAPLRQTFSCESVLKQKSSFSQAHGYKFADGGKKDVKAGTPCITDGVIRIDTDKTHNWHFNDSNETEITFSTTRDVNVDAGQAVRVKATIMSADISIPYKAEVQTASGSKATIDGKWRGELRYDFNVKEEDYDG
ncbi:uncharacterized protein PAF06_005325 [Gastrophryne carolinensis]